MLARALFIKRVKVADISRETGVSKRTIYDWIVKDDWDALVKTDDITETYDRRILTILGKSESLTSAELNEIEHLQKLKSQHLKLSGRIAAVTLPGDADPVASTAQQLQGDLLRDNSDQPKSKSQKKKGRPVKNDFRGITKDELLEHAKKTLFKYQYQELQQLLNDPDNETYRNRFFLKSRQIGMTYYFAMEAFILAILEGRNKSFISASKNQSLFFRDYIAGFAFDWFGIDLKGTEKVELVTDHGKVKFTFFSTNSSTSQGVASDVYMDEVFWIRDFEKLERLAGACATQHIYRKTYLSTPSTKSHAAYVLWNGDKYRKLTETDPVEFPPLVMPTAAQLAKGHLGTDGLYRKRITIHNAMDGGFNLVKLYQIRRENLPEAFRQLYECEFIDDQTSAFILDQLLGCAANDDRWHGYKADAARPYGNRPVAVGYDPSRSGDKAEVVVLGIPATSAVNSRC